MPLSTKKRTATTKQQEATRAAPSSNSPAMPTLAPAPLPTPSIPATPASPAPASSSPSYKPITDDVSIERLVSLAKDSPPDSALGIVWRYAFEEGKRIGYSEGAQMVDGIDINEVLKTGFEKGNESGIETGIEIGRDREKRAWGAAGHSTTCITVARPPRGVAIQTDEPPPRPMMTTAAVQVDIPKPPPSLHVAVQADIPWTIPLGIQDTSSQTSPPPSTSLNWADDAASLPILSIRPPPRDLSALRSMKRNPFGSLQRRSKPFRSRVSSCFHQDIPFSRTPHSRYRPQPLCSSSLFPKPHVSPQVSKKEPFISSKVTPPSSRISVLDWDQDPRLSDLSRALKALGWIRP